MEKELIHLHKKKTPEVIEVCLDDKYLHHIEKLEVRSSVTDGTAELLIRMKVKYP